MISADIDKPQVYQACAAFGIEWKADNDHYLGVEFPEGENMDIAKSVASIGKCFLFVCYPGADIFPRCCGGQGDQGSF